MMIAIRMMVLMVVDMQGEQLNRVEANLDTINSEVLVNNILMMIEMMSMAMLFR